ncbi:twin-arginine translocation signal domain-containing protein [Dyella nitratireducens]|uniref:Tat (Twin-arginine translocation) pathway signal sequence n=1 Tax=Dyella nitratireducens TaxID=1849580 RepID=A0ABQ1GV43_9GAMM|nr:twin-arginine translocation signal domain-containing protein [Dyella nitratireducens]GGA50577.1 hypothetical protein GCM10010981_44930 [Dyella nitratireducens]GLQ42608.1 hypothetical protein GCM10007902_24580 [Dyella nitratireducens]
MKPRDIDSRRRFLKFAASIAAATVLAEGLPRVARADDLSKVSEADPVANARGCFEDVRDSSNAERNAGNACAGCQFYKKKPEKPDLECTFHSAVGDLCL